MIVENKPVVDLDWLCNWLEENSSGIYRPAKEAAHVIRSMSSELESLRAQLKVAQEPVGEVAGTYTGTYSVGNVFFTKSGEPLPIGTALYTSPIPSQQSPAVAGPDSFRKAIFEQPDEAKELVIGVDDNDCPYFILGAQKFRLDPTVIENREDAKWYQKQLSIAFEKFTANANIQPSPRITEQDAREMALSAWRYWMNNCDRTVDNWIEDEGSALLDKLNGKME